MRGQMPALVRPMLATLGELPPESADDEYAYETKFDGVRLVAYLSGGTLRLMTRNDIDVTATYPEIGGLVADAGSVELILDGEIVAFEPHTGRSSFETLQARVHLQDKTAITKMIEKV